MAEGFEGLDLLIKIAADTGQGEAAQKWAYQFGEQLGELTKEFGNLDAASAATNAKFQERFKALGQQATEVENHFDKKLPSSITSSNRMLELLTYNLGIPMPRALRSAVSALLQLGPAFEAAFKGLVVLAVIGYIIKIIEKIKEWQKAAEELERGWLKLNTATIESSEKIGAALDQQKTKYIELTQGPLKAMEYELVNMRSVGLQAFGDISKAMGLIIAQMTKMQHWYDPFTGGTAKEAEKVAQSMADRLEENTNKSLALNEQLKRMGKYDAKTDAVRVIDAQLEALKHGLSEAEHKRATLLGEAPLMPGEMPIDASSLKPLDQLIQKTKEQVRNLQQYRELQIQTYATAAKSLDVAKVDKYTSESQKLFGQEEKNALARLELSKIVAEGEAGNQELSIKQLKDFEDRRYEQERKALDQKFALLNMDRVKNAVELNTKNSQMEALEIEHGKRLAVIGKEINKRTAETQKEMMESWLEPAKEQFKLFWDDIAEGSRAGMAKLEATTGAFTALRGLTAEEAGMREYINALAGGTDALRLFNSQQEYNDFILKNSAATVEQRGRAWDTILRKNTEDMDKLRIAQDLSYSNELSNLAKEIDLLHQDRQAWIDRGVSAIAYDALIGQRQQDFIHGQIQQLLATEKLKNGLHAFFVDYQNQSRITAATVHNFMMRSMQEMTRTTSEFLMNGTADWKELARNIIQSLIEITLQFVISHTLMAGLSKIFGTQQAATNAGIASSHAYVAGAKALAEVPWPLNLVESGAEIAMGLGFAAMAGSFERGGIQRSDGFAFLHKEEGVLPSNLTNLLMNAAIGNQGGGRGGDQYSVNIRALDARSFREYTRKNQNEIMKITRNVARNRK